MSKFLSLKFLYFFWISIFCHLLLGFWELSFVESDSLEFLFLQSFVGLYLWKDQEFKIVEEVWPPLKMKKKVGHTSSTILNSCSFQRYRPVGCCPSNSFYFPSFKGEGGGFRAQTSRKWLTVAIFWKWQFGIMDWNCSDT